MPESNISDRKVEYFSRLQSLLDKYPKILIVGCDNVGSNHMQRIRSSLRGQAELLMGKKTMMRKAIRQHMATNPHLESLLPHIHGNIGFVFTNLDLSLVRDRLVDLKVAAPAKVGSTSPVDVIVPAGNTGMEPTMTSFLQALNIASKINKGQVEILQDIHLIKKGDKVGASESTLLQKLNIRPFSYGLIPKIVYDNGAVFETKVLDMTDADVFGQFSAGLANIAAVSLALGMPNIASVPHSLRTGFANMLHVSIATDFNFKQAEKIKAIASDPAAAAAAMAAAAAAAAPKGGKEDAIAAAKKKKEEEERKRKEEEAKAAEEEEEDMDMGLDLFG